MFCFIFAMSRFWGNKQHYHNGHYYSFTRTVGVGSLRMVALITAFPPFAFVYPIKGRARIGFYRRRYCQWPQSPKRLGEGGSSLAVVYFLPSTREGGSILSFTPYRIGFTVFGLPPPKKHQQRHIFLFRYTCITDGEIRRKGFARRRT